MVIIFGRQMMIFGIVVGQVRASVFLALWKAAVERSDALAASLANTLISHNHF